MADPRSTHRWSARRWDCFREWGFVNAYGLTETSSTIAVLTPDDHREAHTAAQSGGDDVASGRTATVGRPVPGIEVPIRDKDRPRVLGPGGDRRTVRPPASRCPAATPASARCSTTRAGSRPRTSRLLDEAGYLFIGGRSDDTIIRGVNIAPAELEDVLIEHPHVHEVAVVGADDPQWGQAIVAVVVPVASIDPDPDELREHVAKKASEGPVSIPDRVVFHDELPTNAAQHGSTPRVVASLNSTRIRCRPVTGNEPMVKNGTRLAGQVDNTQVIVVKSADSLDDLRCGGTPMVAPRRREVRWRTSIPQVRRWHSHGQALCRRGVGGRGVHAHQGQQGHPSPSAKPR